MSSSSIVGGESYVLTLVDGRKSQNRKYINQIILVMAKVNAIQ
jgi:hypothetical protein